MPLTVEAVYEDGVLKPVQALPLQEHQAVTITVHTGEALLKPAAGIIACADPKLIEWAAMDPELDFPAAAEVP